MSHQKAGTEYALRVTRFWAGGEKIMGICKAGGLMEFEPLNSGLKIYTDRETAVNASNYYRSWLNECAKGCGGYEVEVVEV